ncbi:MAG: hypothetical protein Q9166_000294 [cf. Caloplaca sp. 2 TL-2023]
MTQAFNPQPESPLYNRIPPEVRNQIFTLALAAYEDPNKPYRPSAYYYRPGFTCAHQIDIDLLLTCRCIYWETYRLPASINEHTSWYYREPLGLRNNEIPLDDSPGSLVRRRDLQTIHVFAQQVFLEGDGFAGFTGLWNYACPTTLIITLRHNDWWWWEDEAPLTFDPKQEGQASEDKHSRPSDPFAPRSWGNQFRKINGLKKLQIELETVEDKKRELDAIVDRADGWEFPLGDDRALYLNKSKTRRTGWVGAKLDTSNEEGVELDVILADGIGDDDTAEDLALTPDLAPNETPPVESSSQQPSNQEGERGKVLKGESTARERLKAAGVVFDDAGSVEVLPEHQTSTYYVVTLTWEAH